MKLCLNTYVDKIITQFLESVYLNDPAQQRMKEKYLYFYPNTFPIFFVLKCLLKFPVTIKSNQGYKQNSTTKFQYLSISLEYKQCTAHFFLKSKSLNRFNVFFSI